MEIIVYRLQICQLFSIFEEFLWFLSTMRVNNTIQKFAQCPHFHAFFMSGISNLVLAPGGETSLYWCQIHIWWRSYSCGWIPKMKSFNHHTTGKTMSVEFSQIFSWSSWKTWMFMSCKTKIYQPLCIRLLSLYYWATETFLIDWTLYP